MTRGDIRILLMDTMMTKYYELSSYYYHLKEPLLSDLHL